MPGTGDTDSGFSGIAWCASSACVDSNSIPQTAAAINAIAAII
jgi:hypothetical protein